MSERSPDTSHRQGSKHRRREPLCARNTRFRAIPNAQTSPEHSSSTAICNHCLANHTTASTNGSNPQQRSGPLSARVNIYFLTSDHQPLIVIGHVPIFLGSHPSSEILAWRYKAMAFKIVSKPVLSKIVCIAKGIICDLDGVMRPTLFTRL